MKFDHLSGSGTLASDELELESVSSRIVNLFEGLHQIAPETFPEEWYDTFQYVGSSGKIPEQLIDLSNVANARSLAERGQMDVDKGVQISTTSSIRLRTPGDIPFQVDGKIGGFAGTVNSFLLIVNPARYSLARDRDYLILSKHEIREAVIHIARVLRFDEILYFASGGQPNPQVNLPPIGDRAARRKASGPRWRGQLGWFTYLDTSVWEMDIDESALPPNVLIEPVLNGVTIQLGDDHTNVPDLLLAQARRAIGWEYRRDVLSK
ncbi:hypothetical protein [Gordonia sp. (in: high G+C Gram-positive bacteria)]|uniref:hypothetical protein n=1 Tax=Gordonia sp. (in: high G+C Gram-positive bacteria) TaxID=84139 RepID=UPI003C760B6E